MPAVKIEKDYAKLARNKVLEKREREFIQEKISEAKSISENIEQVLG